MQGTCIGWLIVAVVGQGAGDADCRIWREAPESPPHPKVPGALVYDAGAHATLLVGSGETWRWAKNEWALLDNTTTPNVQDHVLVYDQARGVVVLFGGHTLTEFAWVPSAETWEWDGVEWSLRTSEGPGARSGCAACYDARRQVVTLHGGADWTGALSDTWEWDGVEWQWVPAWGPGYRAGHHMFFDAKSGRAILFGGEDDTEMWAWDGASWEMLDAQSPQPFQEAFVALDPSRSTIVVLDRHGGTWEWDGSTWWTNPSFPHIPQSEGDPFYSMSFDEFAGRVISYVLADQFSRSFAGTFEWNGIKWDLRDTTDPPGRYLSSLIYDSHRDVVWLFGGSRLPWRPQAETWKWSGGRWLIAAEEKEGPTSRDSAATTFDGARGVVILFGGVGYGQSPVAHCCALGDTWEWDGAKWATRNVEGPQARFGAAMAYDENRGVSVLFGGTSREFYDVPYLFGDTWEWDGETWTPTLIPGPSPRTGHSMVFDSTRGTVLLFGGDDSDVDDCHVSAETWGFDGARWTMLSSEGPPARTGQTMFFDRNRGMAVLHGGYRPCEPKIINDAWEWDGTAWRYRGRHGPLTTSAAATFHESLGVGLEFGGFTSDYKVVGTWLHDSMEVPDMDGDCDVDLFEVSALQNCYLANVDGTLCSGLDDDSDGQIGPADFKSLIRSLIGPTQP